MKKPGDSFLKKLMRGIFVLFVLQLLQKVLPENERGEEKKGSWEKLVEAVGKPLYGDVALVIFQILLFAVTSASMLEQEWFIEVRLEAILLILFLEAICCVIYCFACNASTIALFCLVVLVVLSFVLLIVGESGVKGPVTYWVQLGLQSVSLISAMLASRQIKSNHPGS